MAARTVESFIKSELKDLPPQLRELIEDRKRSIGNTYWQALENLAEEYGGIHSIQCDHLYKTRRGNALYNPIINWNDSNNDYKQPPTGEYTLEQARIQISKILLYRLKSISFDKMQDSNTI